MPSAPSVSASWSIYTIVPADPSVPQSADSSVRQWQLIHLYHIGSWSNCTTVPADPSVSHSYICKHVYIFIIQTESRGKSSFSLAPPVAAEQNVSSTRVKVGTFLALNVIYNSDTKTQLYLGKENLMHLLPSKLSNRLISRTVCFQHKTVAVNKAVHPWPKQQPSFHSAVTASATWQTVRGAFISSFLRYFHVTVSISGPVRRQLTPLKLYKLEGSSSERKAVETACDSKCFLLWGGDRATCGAYGHVKAEGAWILHCSVIQCLVTVPAEASW